MSFDHLPLSGRLSLGFWSLELFSELRLGHDAPSEDFLVGLVNGRLRIAVVDPALNDLLPGRTQLQAGGWSTVYEALRTHEDPLDALVEANARVHVAGLGPTEGVILCVAVVDLHPTEPLLVRAVRAGDCEVRVDGRGLLTGECFDRECYSKWVDEKTRLGLDGADPRRWALQARLLPLGSYTCTPVGVAEEARFESWGAAPARSVIVATDGAAGVGNFADLLPVCGKDPGKYPSPHGDRTWVKATFTE